VTVGAEPPPEAGELGIPLSELDAVPSPALFTALI
jgi:hypothetical protein